MTRIPECPVVYCPAPTDPDWHHCLICGRQEVEHHHTEPRGMGGSKSRKMDTAGVIPLCRDHHELVTLRYSDGILKDVYVEGVAGKVDLYRIWDLHNETIFEKIVRREEGGAAAEETTASAALQSGDAMSPTGSAAAPPSSPIGDPPAVPAVSPHSFAGKDSVGWRATDLKLEEDQDLAEQFHRYYGMSGMLRLEAYRRIEAFRLKYAVAGEHWRDKAEGVFDLSKSTLDDYSRAWRAFEGAVEEKPEFLEPMQEMGGGTWQIVGRAQSERWPEMVEVALSVVADTGPGKGLPSRVAARAQEEGVLPKSLRRYTVAQLRALAIEFDSISGEPPLAISFVEWLESRG